MAKQGGTGGAGLAAQVRRTYEGRMGVVPARKVAKDVAAVLEDRRNLQRAAEALADAAAPYAADARVKAALDGLRAALEGRA